MLFAGGHHVCASCPASGRCALQELATLTGLDAVRVGVEAPRHPVDASRARFALDPGRCILCTRCVRACSELEGVHALAVVGRGSTSRIATDGATWGESRACTDCGRCVFACPTGALFEKSFAAQGLLPRHDRPPVPGPAPLDPGTRRLRLATLWLGGCSGCHMSLLDLDGRLLDLAPRLDLVYSPLNDAKDYPDDVDVCLVEGAVATDEDAALLARVRARTRLVVALGDCAVTGNVTAMRDGVGGAAAVLARSWSGPGGVPARDPGLPALLDRVLPLHEQVRVDLSLPGCPPPADLLHLVLSDLVDGRSPDLEGLLRFG
jgi:NAD-reducing hydrogenase small subunit